MPTLITRGAASIRGFGFAGASAPVNTVAPVVSGTATNGQTLSSTTGTWVGSPAPSYTYQWQRGGSNIGGATSSTYLLTNSDVGSTIRCVVTATNAVAAVSANSNSTAAVAAIVPGAPVIGTATSTGITTATVSYTAPSSNGGATITSYTAVSSPGGITGSLSTSGSGTISVSGLTGATTYTFTVYATNSAGNSASSSASNSITTSTPVSYMNVSTSGACVYTSGDYKTAVFYGSGSFTVNSLGNTGNYANHVNYLIVAGGGSGGSKYAVGGGGGAGFTRFCAGSLCSAGVAVSATSYSVTVGGGGAIGTINIANNGCNSSFNGLTANGGGGGGQYQACQSQLNGRSGGNGGGGGQCYTSTYFPPGGSSNAGCSTYGHSGGSGLGTGSYLPDPCGGCYYNGTAGYAGGGGGAGASGNNGSTSYPGGKGGAGISTPSIFTGAPSTIAAGGGGMVQTVFSYSWCTSLGLGGSGSTGGNGLAILVNTRPRCASSPTAYTGSGGGGGNNPASGGAFRYGTPGAGGVVAIRWRFQ
jgi:hypothetical protein